MYVFLGTCKEVPMGPTAIVSLMTYNTLHGLGPVYGTLLCFLTGVIQLLMGVVGLGMYMYYMIYSAQNVACVGLKTIYAYGFLTYRHRLLDRFHFRPGELGLYVGGRDTDCHVTDKRLDRRQSCGIDSVGHDRVDIQRHKSFSTGRHVVWNNLYYRHSFVESKYFYYHYCYNISNNCIYIYNMSVWPYILIFYNVIF